MFQIILWILKIIGILLAAILGIAVLLVCIVLFVPVRYQIEAESAGTFESIDAHARFSWLLYLFSGYLYKPELLSLLQQETPTFKRCFYSIIF